MLSNPSGPERASPVPDADQHDSAPPDSLEAERHGPEMADTQGQSLDLLIRNVADILTCEVALYCRAEPEGQRPAVISSWGAGPGSDGLRPGRGGFVDRALRERRAVLGPLHPVHDASLVSPADGLRLTHAVAAPVRVASGIVGGVVGAFAELPADHRLTLWAAEACAAMVALCMHDPDLLLPLLQPASMDPLTGCLGYAGTRHELEREINRSTRRGLALSLCFIDLDNFKRINDQHGHLHGNDVLAQVGRALRGGVRSCDSVGRFGGDEFVAILPETAETDAVRLASRLRTSIATSSLSFTDHPLAASIGVAERAEGETADALLERADQLMLLTKEHRGARVTRTYLRRLADGRRTPS
jgi:diguanylate cyclase (GGDEF)-like protein